MILINDIVIIVQLTNSIRANRFRLGNLYLRTFDHSDHHKMRYRNQQYSLVWVRDCTENARMCHRWVCVQVRSYSMKKDNPLNTLCPDFRVRHEENNPPNTLRLDFRVQGENKTLNTLCLDFRAKDEKNKTLNTLCLDFRVQDEKNKTLNMLCLDFRVQDEKKKTPNTLHLHFRLVSVHVCRYSV